MRLQGLILLVLLAGLLGLTALVVAQGTGETTPDPTNDWVPITPPEAVYTQSSIWQPTETANTGTIILSPLANAAKDTCSTATLLSFVPNGVPDSSTTDTFAMSIAADDPALSCMWGSNPPSVTGYRTAWYKFTSAYNGLVTINTSTSVYDTVLGVFTGSCGAASLVSVACDDDTTGFTSQVSFVVRRNTTYYVEVADWQPGPIFNPLTMNFQAFYNTPIVSEWRNVSFMTSPVLPRGRHASLAVGDGIYVLGGQTAGSGVTQLSNGFFRYNTTNDSWTTLDLFPGQGIRNTTAVYLTYDNGGTPVQEIHVPGGSIALDDSAYTNEHWVYDIPTGGWSLRGAVGSEPPFAYATAVASPVTLGYYVLGGIEGPGWPLSEVLTDSVRSDVLIYRPDLNAWETRTAMTTPRYGHTAALVGDRVCVAGGLRWNAGTTPPVALLTNGECANRLVTTWTATGNMNVPRYFAHSAIGPDGYWYVYGGIDQSGKAVPEVEYYDPATNTWLVMGYLFDLNGRQASEPALVWPGGGFVGNTLWAIGGSTDLSGNVLYPIVKALTLERGDLYLPYLLAGTPENFALKTAWYLPIDQVQGQTIASADNRHRFFQVNLPGRSAFVVQLSVPDGEDLDLYLYDANKRQWGLSENPFPGAAEQVCVNNLQAGTYYIDVTHVWPVQPDSTKTFGVVARVLATCP